MKASLFCLFCAETNEKDNKIIVINNIFNLMSSLLTRYIAAKKIIMQVFIKFLLLVEKSLFSKTNQIHIIPAKNVFNETT